MIDTLKPYQLNRYLILLLFRINPYRYNPKKARYHDYFIVPLLSSDRLQKQFLEFYFFQSIKDLIDRALQNFRSLDYNIH